MTWYLLNFNTLYDNKSIQFGLTVVVYDVYIQS